MFIECLENADVVGVLEFVGDQDVHSIPRLNLALVVRQHLVGVDGPKVDSTFAWDGN